jgi:hypothetical protein
MDILDFIRDRIENETSLCSDFLDELSHFQDELARMTEDVDFSQGEDEVYPGDFLAHRLQIIPRWQQENYKHLSDEIQTRYGSAPRQLILYYALHSDRCSTMKLGAFQKDPRVLLFFLFSMLLGDQIPDPERIRSMLMEPVLEGISRAESTMLCSLLYRE